MPSPFKLCQVKLHLGILPIKLLSEEQDSHHGSRKFKISLEHRFKSQKFPAKVRYPVTKEKLRIHNFFAILATKVQKKVSKAPKNHDMILRGISNTVPGLGFELSVFLWLTKPKCTFFTYRQIKYWKNLCFNTPCDTCIIWPEFPIFWAPKILDPWLCTYTLATGYLSQVGLFQNGRESFLYHLTWRHLMKLFYKLRLKQQTSWGWAVPS